MTFKAECTRTLRIVFKPMKSLPFLATHPTMKFISLLYLLFVAISPVHSVASNSLADCNAVASQFRSTCGGVPVSNITATAGTTVSCSSGFTNLTCPGIMNGSTCVFAHKLCVTCSGSPTVRIRVQTNGLPSFCPNAPGRISELNIDFQVNFNPDVSVNMPNHNPTTTSALSSIVCSITNQASAPAASNFTQMNNGNPMMTLAGVSVDGVTILNVNSANNVDPFFPTGPYSAESVDACLGHPNPSDNGYHYHAASACALNPPSGTISSCSGTPACSAHVGNYSVSTFSSNRSLTVIGIAKDGHIIYGPYTAAGVQVTSGFDICNGMFHDSIGNYGYFATRTYPYITGCFGPGNYPSFMVNCSTNLPSAYTKSIYAINQTISTTTSLMTSGSTTTLMGGSTPPMVTGSTTTMMGGSTPPMMNGSTTTLMGGSTPPMVTGSTTTLMGGSTPPMMNGSTTTSVRTRGSTTMSSGNVLSLTYSLLALVTVATLFML